MFGKVRDFFFFFSKRRSHICSRAINSLSTCGFVHSYAVALFLLQLNIERRRGETRDLTAASSNGSARSGEVMEGLQLSWKRQGVGLRKMGPVCFVYDDHVARGSPSPSPVTTDSTVSGCCSGQLLQNGCKGSAVNEKPLNVSW